MKAARRPAAFLQLRLCRHRQRGVWRHVGLRRRRTLSITVVLAQNRPARRYAHAGWLSCGSMSCTPAFMTMMRLYDIKPLPEERRPKLFDSRILEGEKS